MLRYASVIIDISHENVDRMFQYRIPEHLLPQIWVGSLVLVPFGAGKRPRKGWVVDITDKAEYDESKLKEIDSLVEKGITADENLIRLAWWMKERYGSTMNQALKTVLPVKRQVRARRTNLWEEMAGEEFLAGSVRLNEEQRRIVDSFCADYKSADRRPYLIHGITGSGKTEVYMEMIDYVLRQGRQAIVLIPEIALTWQTVRRFYARFGEEICVMHSRLSAGERYEQFARARRGETSIMIGARSALFTPFSRLGLIVMDEEHEGAYKSETSPRYHAREVALELARMHGAMVVMGSATPSLEAYSRAKAGIFRLFKLEKRAGGGQLTRTEVVDLRRELAEGNKSIFSRRLQELITGCLSRGEQAMLFMNRRGYANFVSCRGCGEAIRCPHCDVSLTLHDSGRLVCHYCGYTRPMPKICPSCGSSYLAGFGIGTQQIERLAGKMFPDARILRMDSDTTRRKGGHEAILSAFAAGKADILIGTQMIVKGHDFPGVTLVGILAADVSLYAPDYRSAEHTFELLVQASGRAGRGKRPGTALIQTYAPRHYSIRTAAAQDYEEFYRQESAYRRLMHYPPFSHMMALQVSGEDEELTAHMIGEIAAAVERRFGDRVTMIGPVPAPVYKIKDIYRKILYLKQENYDILIRIQKYVQDRWDETEDCRKLAIQYDFS
ncbi:MAG: primosomal protein N' [Clostridiales bacterium]|nr:primosomal protein N' [Clostridiales bacterium]